MAGKKPKDGPFINPRHGGGFHVGYRDGDYCGPEAEVYLRPNTVNSQTPDWVVICTDDYEGHAALNVEALPKLRRALSLLAKQLKDSAKFPPA